MTQLFTLPKTMLRMALSVAALLLVFTATSTFAAEPVVLTDSIDSYPLGLHFEYYEDTTGSLTLQDVLSPEVSRQFKQNKKIVANFGKTRSAYWFRFTVMNRMSSAQELLLASSWPLYDHIDLFIQNRSGVYEHREHGNVFPFHHREIDNRNFVFRISPPRNEPQVVYIRIQTETSMQAPFTIQKNNVFHARDKVDFGILFLYFGILIAMIIYNLFVYIFIKDKDYLFYVLYQFVHMMFQISYLGLGYYFIWSYFPTIEKHSMPFILGIGCISVLIFSKSFLKIAKYNILNIIFIIFITINCMVTASTFANIYIPLIILNYLNLISILLMIISAFYCIKKGFSSAWYFVISWMVFLAGSVLIVLKNLGIVESNYFTNYSMQFGSAIEVIVMSIALSDKINVMKQEKELAQEEVITIQRSYSDSLEKTVNERTYELEIERNKLHRRNKIMENEIALARKIQESLIPEGNPAAYISSMYKPMEEVGGDFYDFIKLDDSDRIGIFLSDVSGHGVHAAFITSMIKTILLQAGDRIYDPAGLLLYMNEVLQGQTAGNFVTAFYGIFNPDDSSLYYSNAGHNQPYIITPECVSQLQGGKNTAIAMFPNNMLSKANKKFLNFQEQVPSGSKLLLYTDGLVEARPVGEDIFFEYANMEDVFRAHAGVHCSDFLDILMQELTSFRKSDSFEDDICLICMDVE